MLTELSRAALVRAHLKLARLMQRRSRLAVCSVGAAYPEDLERTVLAHVGRELARMGLGGRTDA